MGRLWLSTSKGLAAFDRSNESFRTFNAADGLQSSEFNSSAFFALKDGRLAFGSVDGLTLFSPQAVVGSRYPAPVVFTNVTVGDRERTVPSVLGAVHMAQADRIVRFEFAALDYAAPERNRFQYKLDGFDTKWTDGATQFRDIWSRR